MQQQGKACRHCGSPARNNPCWYDIKYPSYRYTGGDPPCFCDIYAEEQELLSRRDWCYTWIMVGLILLAALTLGCVAVWAEELTPPTPEEALSIQSWIPARCCRTNNCCMKVSEDALIALPDNQVRVRTTGQILPRTGWSQDKNTWRCTCDWLDGKWVVHPNANTRCVFDHLNGS